MIGRYAYRVNAENKHFESVVEILTKEFNLVDGTGESATGPYRVLVWEDESGIGRYRVHCKKGNFEKKGVKYDTIIFQYWANERLLKEILEKDPMKSAFEKVYSQAENPIDIPQMCNRLTIEQFLE